MSDAFGESFPDTVEVDAGQGAGDVAAEGGLTVSLGQATDQQIREATTAVSSMLRGLDFAFLQVREFHKAFGHPVADRPTPLPRDRREQRAKWMNEETQEFVDAEDLADQVDANIDGIYFHLGNLVEMGVLPQAMMDFVHGANMGKMHEVDGKMVVVKNSEGKVIKPDNWQRDHAPEGKIQQELELQDAAGLLRKLGA